ncbi:hypothetical protein KIPB_015496, partial [Kipferlia bialata]|eukprot:g15496.t1
MSGTFKERLAAALAKAERDMRA